MTSLRSRNTGYLPFNFRISKLIFRLTFPIVKPSMLIIHSRLLRSRGDMEVLQHSLALPGLFSYLFLYRKDCGFTIKKRIHGDSRIVVLEVLSNPPLCICNVYMPSRNSRGNSRSDDSYQNSLDQLKEILKIYSDSHAVYLLGDFNASMTQRKGNSQDRMLEAFVSKNSLEYQQKGQSSFTHPNK